MRWRCALARRGVMLLPMEPHCCPFCASDDLAVINVEQDSTMLTVSCKECGAQGPLSLSDDPVHAIQNVEPAHGPAFRREVIRGATHLAWKTR